MDWRERIEKLETEMAALKKELKDIKREVTLDPEKIVAIWKKNCAQAIRDKAPIE